MKDHNTITASFVSLGCFKNLVDTEVLGGLLEKRNIRIVSSYEKSDWLLINTCGFIQDAKEESIDEIFEALEKKEQGDYAHIAVFGCMTQRYIDDLAEQFKDVDILWGVNDIEELADAIVAFEKSAGGGQGRGPRYGNKKLFLYDDTYKRIIATTPNVCFIKISEGCNMKCSFCAIPAIRGPYRSRSIDSIIQEAAKYRDMGFQEINLVSQNSTYFGRDGGAGKSALPVLLKEISRLGIPWVRVLYLMPEEVTDELLEAFANPSILPYFDLPFQHAAVPLLKRMNRGGSVQENLELIRRIRVRHKSAVIRSSFIVGFPGETQEHFDELVEFAGKSRIERIGVFGYSDEEGTMSFAFPGEEKIPQEVIELRKELLMDVSSSNIEKYNEGLDDTEQEFLPLAPWEGGLTVGRIKSQGPDTDGLTLVDQVFTDEYEIYKIKITGFQDELLYGNMIS